MTPSREQIQLVDVLAAIGHPVRAKIVKVLADGAERPCRGIAPDVPKSTLTSHWRVLTDSGVIYQRPVGRNLFITLRRDDLDARFPGLIDLVIQQEEVDDPHDA
ncbi:ArsR/SmtB family transcription factor [Nonomuraea sp. NPDC050556]|uniref:ArsR/SmtB family transcription factor n=1 Tax=Nonomuraea sp. NPDC050556 TaxID=3364369 RepID=UPI0037A2128A